MNSVHLLHIYYILKIALILDIMIFNTFHEMYYYNIII